MAKADLTAARLRELLHYDPETGIFTWLKTVNNNKALAGSVAGHYGNERYVRITILRTRCYAHRLAWLYVYGVWPSEHIDHIDGNPSNNRIANLRAVSRFENMQNMVKPTARSLSGYLGAHKARGGKWTSRIMANGTTTGLGIFDTPEEAHAAYLEAKRRLHSTCTI